MTLKPDEIIAKQPGQRYISGKEIRKKFNNFVEDNRNKYIEKEVVI